MSPRFIVILLSSLLLSSVLTDILSVHAIALSVYSRHSVVRLLHHSTYGSLTPASLTRSVSHPHHHHHQYVLISPTHPLTMHYSSLLAPAIPTKGAIVKAFEVTTKVFL